MATFNMHQFTADDGNVYNFTDDDAQNTADTALAVASAAHDAANGTGTYSSSVPLGRNLATFFAGEIGSTPVPTWLKQHATAGDYRDFDIGDYIAIALNNSSHTSLIYQLGAFNMYTGIGDTANGNMITLVPTAVFPESVQFNTSDDNNGTADETSPWRASHLYEWMNTTFKGYLPAEWQAVLKNIRVYNPIRYTAGSKLTADNGSKWMELGQIWAPSEIEVWGAPRHSTPSNGTTQVPNTDRQLPIFESGRTVIRSRSLWWERSAAVGSSTNACNVSSTGFSYCHAASTAGIRPLPCFHIG